MHCASIILVRKVRIYVIKLLEKSWKPEFKQQTLRGRIKRT